MENMERSERLKDACPASKSKSVQNLVATGRGVHAYAAGESMFPFTQGDLQESGETGEESKKEH